MAEESLEERYHKECKKYLEIHKIDPESLSEEECRLLGDEFPVLSQNNIYIWESHYKSERSKNGYQESRLVAPTYQLARQFLQEEMIEREKDGVIDYFVVLYKGDFHKKWEKLISYAYIEEEEKWNCFESPKMSLESGKADNFDYIEEACRQKMLKEFLIKKKQ